MALALLADQLERQQAAQGVLGRNPLRAREPGLIGDRVQVEVPHHRHEQEQPGDPGAEAPAGEVERASVGSGRPLGLGGLGALIVSAARQAGEALFAEQDREGVDAELMSLLPQLVLNVVDGEISLAQGHDALPDAIAGRSGLGAAADVFEIALLGVGLAAELVAQDAEGAGGVAEVAGDLGGGSSLGEVGAQGFVLAMQGFLGLAEEAGRSPLRYRIRATDRHAQSMLFPARDRNPLIESFLSTSRSGGLAPQ
jgi:hypothetical protein